MKVDLKHAFGLKPEKAIEYFQAKGYEITWDWHEMLNHAHDRAFTVAKAMRLDILQDIHGSLSDALENGLTYAEWRKGLEPTLKTKGWWGEVVNQATGEIATVGPWRLRTIFDTNIQTAYSAGRYRSQAENIAARPFWEYVAVMDARTRPAHAALNGTVLRADDPFWDSYYPPLGYRCRCRVRAHGADDVAEKELKVQSSDGRMGTKEVEIGKTGEKVELPTFKVGKMKISPDVGFDHNPGKTDWQPDPAKYSPDLRRLL